MKYGPKIMPFIKELWNNISSSCKNWHNKIKWFSIFIKPNKCQKNRKEKQKWKNLPGPYLRPAPVLAQHCAAWPGPTGQASHPPPCQEEAKEGTASARMHATLLPACPPSPRRCPPQRAPPSPLASPHSLPSSLLSSARLLSRARTPPQHVAVSHRDHRHRPVPCCCPGAPPPSTTPPRRAGRRQEHCSVATAVIPFVGAADRRR